MLIRPLMLNGAAQIEGGPPAVVITPWHPLRLAAMQQKAILVTVASQVLADGQ